MDHNRRPRNFGILEDATSKSEGFNPLCGDQVTLYLKVQGDEIIDIAFDGVGCAISKSSASMMTEEIKGKTLEEAESIFEAFRDMITRKHGDDYRSEMLGDLEILNGVSQYPARIKCATLSWHTLQSAIKCDGNAVATTE